MNTHGRYKEWIQGFDQKTGRKEINENLRVRGSSFWLKWNQSHYFWGNFWHVAPALDDR
jgi:hypothetical protein